MQFSAHINVRAKTRFKVKSAFHCAPDSNPGRECVQTKIIEQQKCLIQHIASTIQFQADIYNFLSLELNRISVISSSDNIECSHSTAKWLLFLLLLSIDLLCVVS